MLVNMIDILAEAEAKGYGIPCINTPNMETLRAVIGAAEELNTPVIIDHAEVHNSLIPIERMGPEMIKAAKASTVPVCVHLDHGKSYTFLMRALEANFPSIMFDNSDYPFEENVARTAEFVKFAHERGISVEGELGIMASAMEDTHDDGEDKEKRVLTNADIRKFFTDPDQAAEFAERTGVDALAVCFGTMHGIYAEPPVLDIERVKAIRKAVKPDCRIVMHGSSGVAFDQCRAAISAGCSKINYYSYMAKSATQFAADTIAKSEGKIAYHELAEACSGHMKEYAKMVLTEFRNGTL